MKILFMADLHIKLNQKNVPEMWARNRYKMLWKEVKRVALENECSHIMHGGDVFDRVPTPAEFGVLLEMLEALKEFKHVIYPGNHEATSKFKSFWQELKALPMEIILEFTEWLPGIHILPYTDLKKKHWHGIKGDMLFTHVRGEIIPHVKPEIDLDLLNTWDKVIAGDLHAHSNSQYHILYPGSPITTSFHRSESNGENGVFIVDTNDFSCDFIELTLPQLIRHTVDCESRMVPTDYHHSTYELVGTVAELAHTANSALLDKRILKRETEATLALENKTVEEQLKMYLTDVEKIEDPSKIIKTYADIKNTNMV